MKKIILSLIAVLSLCSGANAVDPITGNKHTPTPAFFEFGVVYPVQLFQKSDDVYGMRLGLPGVTNRDVYAVDIALAGFSRNFCGLSVGLFSETQKDSTGLFVNVINQAGTTLNGVQLGAVNLNGFTTNRGTQFSLEHSYGTQVGIVNTASNYFVGLQLAVCNFANNGSALQLGFINMVQPNQEMNGRIIKLPEGENPDANKVVQIGAINFDPGAKYPISVGYEPLQRVIFDSCIWMYEKSVSLFVD